MTVATREICVCLNAAPAGVELGAPALALSVPLVLPAVVAAADAVPVDEPGAAVASGDGLAVADAPTPTRLPAVCCAATCQRSTRTRTRDARRTEGSVLSAIAAFMKLSTPPAVPFAGALIAPTIPARQCGPTGPAVCLQ